MNSKLISRAQLKPLQRQLAVWRQTARPRQAIPEPLWQAAAALAQRWGVSPVSRSLRLNYAALKRRTLTRVPASAGPPKPPAFVELAWPLGSTAAPGRLVWEHPLGGKMILEWTGTDAVPLLALAQTFWHRQP